MKKVVMDEETRRQGRAGMEALRRLRKETNWADWMKVGTALVAGRAWAMNAAGTNRPEGRGYNTGLGEWLKHFHLDTIDGTTRAKLFQVMENRAAIETWRATLTLGERLKANHPATVLAKWKAATVVAVVREPGPSHRDIIAGLKEEIAQQAEHIKELEAARKDEVTSPQSDADALDKAVVKAIIGINSYARDDDERTRALAKIMVGARFPIGVDALVDVSKMSGWPNADALEGAVQEAIKDINAHAASRKECSLAVARVFVGANASRDDIHDRLHDLAPESFGKGFTIEFPGLFGGSRRPSRRRASRKPTVAAD